MNDKTDLRCPLCNADALDSPHCAGCGTELAGYRALVSRPRELIEEASRRQSGGNLAGAARSAYAAVAFSPGRGEYRLLLAELLAELGDLAEAIEHVQAALSDEAHVEQAEEMLGGLLERKRAGSFRPPAPP